MRPPGALVALLAVAALCGLAWAVLTPPLQGPDEDTHVAYVQRIVETGELPQNVEEGKFGLSTELAEAERWAGLFGPPTNARQRPNYTEAEREAFERDIASRPGDPAADGTGYRPGVHNPPLFYLFDSVPYAVSSGGDIFTRLQLMRLWQLSLLLFVVWMTWLLVGELLPRPAWARVVGAGVVAVHPVLAFMGAIVNPDIALAAVWSAFFVVAIRMVRHGPTTRRALLLGIVCAASALAHPRGLGIGLPAAITLALAVWRHGVPLRRAVVPAAATLGLAVLGFALYYAVVSIGGSATAAQFEGVSQTNAFNVRQFATYVWQFYLPRLHFMEVIPGDPRDFRYVYVESFFGVFGALDVFLPPWIYSMLWSIALYGIVVGVIGVMLRFDALRRHWVELAVLVAGAGTYALTIHFGAYRTLSGNDFSDAILVGRYLLPLVAPFGLVVAFVVTTLPGRWGRAAGLTVLLGMVALHIAGLGNGLLRWYG